MEGSGAVPGIGIIDRRTLSNRTLQRLGTGVTSGIEQAFALPDRDRCRAVDRIENISLAVQNVLPPTCFDMCYGVASLSFFNCCKFFRDVRGDNGIAISISMKRGIPRVPIR